MSTMRGRIFLGVIAAVLWSVCLAGVSSKAQAGIIPYSVIAPHEYQLPVGSEIPKDGINLLLSYNTFRDESKAYDGESGSKHLFVNINKFVHIFNIEGLTSAGFLWEGVLGFGSAEAKNDTSASGMIDAQTGLVGWIKPTKNWTCVLEYWLYLPIGDNELSGHSWNHSIAFMTNYHIGNFTFDGDIGFKLMGDYEHGGVEASQGDTWFANLVFAYKFHNLVEPFFKVDWQDSGKSEFTSGGDGTVANSNCELALGLGNQFKISDRLNLALWDEQGVHGRNTTKTKAGYARFIWSF